MEAGLVVFQVFVYLVIIGLETSAVYGNVLVYRLCDEFALRKRGLVGHFGLNFALMSQIIFTTLVMASNVSIHQSSVSTPLHLLSIVGAASSALAWICFSLSKSWLIYYRERWSYHTLQSEWYKIIRDDTTAADNWYIRNNHKYGSSVYVTRFFTIYYCVCLAITVFGGAAGAFGWVHAAIETMLVAGPMLLSVTLYLCVICKTTRFKLIDDPFLIHWEAKLHSRLQILFIVVVLLISPTITLSPDIGWMLSTLLPACVMYAIVHVSTYSIYKRLHGIHNVELSSSAPNSSVLSLERVPSARDQPASSSGSASPKPSPRGERIKVTVMMVLANKKALHLFTEHLFKEYSPECILSVIEMQQYLNYLRSQMEISAAEELSEDPNACVRLPDSVPLSSIVDMDTDWRMKAYALWYKYVRVDSEYEVNISWELRKNFELMMKDNAQFLMDNNGLKIQDFYALFDKVKTEMVHLLRFSLSRFKFKEEYDTMVKILEAESKPCTKTKFVY